jgi:hypothetical protein
VWTRPRSKLRKTGWFFNRGMKSRIAFRWVASSIKMTQ